MPESSRSTPFAFVTGGCRSGKSAYAQTLAEQLAKRGLYIATAHVRDEEMRERVRLHQQARGSCWRVHEVMPGKGPDLWRDLPALARPGEALLFDCLTLWAAGCMIKDKAPPDFPAMCAVLLKALWALPCPVIIVGNEVGLGVVPATASGRAFRDMAGLAGQQAAAMSTYAVMLVSGLPLVLKGSPPCSGRR